ncbi:Pyridine nucleotide-disulphide oxidoreductase, dimerisation domain [Halobellus salinus]|nr:Pyridine nucleotide-disulphide oxidoreductase, dimerisation domain [Halobellus salinus]
MFGDDLVPVDYAAVPWAVFASSEVAGVGATEDELRDEGREYATRTYRYNQTDRGDAMHADGFLKAIIDRNGTIIGCHIVGPDAATLFQEVVVAMKAGSGTVQDIRGSIHIHPALSEVVQRGFSGQFTHGRSRG